MILAMDLGNSNIKIGAFKHDKLLFESRIATERDKLSDQYAVELLDIIRLYGVNDSKFTGAILSSVVPQLNNTMVSAIQKVTGCKPLMVGPGTKTGVNILIDNPAQLGGDLLTGAVAAIAQYGTPCIIWDLGTATTVSVIDKNGSFLGGAIMGGVGITTTSLVAKASQLPQISIEAPENVIGSNTVHSMQSGAVYGTASMIDGMNRRIENELGYPATVIITGGQGRDIGQHCERKMIYDDALLLKGLYIIYQKNSKY